MNESRSGQSETMKSSPGMTNPLVLALRKSHSSPTKCLNAVWLQTGLKQCKAIQRSRGNLRVIFKCPFSSCVIPSPNKNRFWIIEKIFHRGVDGTMIIYFACLLLVVSNKLKSGKYFRIYENRKCLRCFYILFPLKL